MADRKKNAGLIYLRRSTDQQEFSLLSQLQWAIAEAARMEVRVEATEADLNFMLEHGLSSYKSLRVDDAISGADMERPGFVSLCRDAVANKAISHLFIHRRDRFGRPDEGMKLALVEKNLRYEGLTLVMFNKVAEPLVRGSSGFRDDIEMLLEYHESSEFLRRLAERVVERQVDLARNGYRTGGDPPYGFVRVLVDAQGKIIEELPKGKRVRQTGCHVRIIPKDKEKIAVWVLILDLKAAGWGGKRIAAHLNRLNIPSPGAGTTRTDQGVRHRVSGKWCQNTVLDLCRNRAMLGLQDYGRRSEGKHRRLGPDGPRLLTDEDRLQTGRAKLVNNSPSMIISAEIGVEPRYDPDKWQTIQDDLEARGKSQRGIPRVKDPASFPLSCRVVDMTDGCGNVMYALSHSGRRVYRCGRYMRTSGAECNNNQVDAEALLRMILATIRQLAFGNGGHEQLRERLLARAQDEASRPCEKSTHRLMLEARHTELVADRETIGRRMAKEADDERYGVIAEEFDRVSEELRQVASELAKQQPPAKMPGLDPQVGVERALAVLARIDKITQSPHARADLPALFHDLGIHIGLSFVEGIKGKKRVVRRPASGVIAFGDAPLPVPLHGHDRLDDDYDTSNAAPAPPNGPDASGDVSNLASGGPLSADAMRQSPLRPEVDCPKSISLTKVNRGNWRSFEPMLAAYLDSALGPASEIVAATRLTRISA